MLLLLLRTSECLSHRKPFSGLKMNSPLLWYHARKELMTGTSLLTEECRTSHCGWRNVCPYPPHTAGFNLAMWSCGDLRGHVSHATTNAAVRVTIILRQDDEIGRRGAGRTDLGKSYPRRNPWAAQWKKGWSWPQDGKDRKNIEKNKHTALKKHSAGGN